MSDYNRRISDFTESIKDQIFSVSKQIFENPELGYNEHKSAALLCELLAKNGFDIQMPYGSQQTAFKAIKKGKLPGPRIAFLCEYDALPVIGHACGHNWIGTLGAFAGITAGKFIEEFPGTIQVIGTPAEESFGGKIYILEEGGFDDTDIAIMAHPNNETVSCYKSLAAQVVEVTFHGKSAHAAASPWNGINALDAMIQTFVMIDNLKKQLSPAFRVPGIIKEGGDRPNIVPEKTVGVFSLRTETLPEMKMLREKIENIFKAAALATGCTYESRDAEKPYAPLNSNPCLQSLFEKNWIQCGGEFRPNPHPGYGSLDIGNVSQKIPCIHPSIAVTYDTSISIHTIEFGKATQSDFGKEQLLRAVKAFAMTAIEIFLNPTLADQMKEELHTSTNQ